MFHALLPSTAYATLAVSACVSRAYPYGALFAVAGAANENPGLGVSTQTRAGCPARTERKSGSPAMCQIMPASGSLTLPWSRLPAGTRDLASGNSNLAEMFFYFFCASRI